MQVEAFIARWSDREGGAERANTMMFLSELCDVIGVARPEPAGADTRFNDYVFERAVRPRESEGAPQPRRIDLYKRDCFILEAKQSRLPGREKALPEREAPPRRAGRATRNWDVMMQNARRQAEGYVFLLDPSHAAPPFLLVVDVGRVIELYADFTGTGRGYGQSPDRNGFRITLDMLREESVRRRLALVWTDPNALDPAREAARVTRGVAERLAVVSRHLEAEHPPAEVAQFLVRCIFTMFAEDVGLLPKDSFSRLLADCVETPEAFAPTVTELWRKMDAPRREDRFFTGFRAHLRHFNGNLFREASAFALPAAEIAELLAAARVRWTEVDPAIFDPFPFPPLEGRTVETLRATAEELDETRRRVLADNPDLTLTGLYNVLDAMRQGAGLSAKQADIRRRGLVLILQELHEAIDRATLQAYGWPAELGQEAVLERLVALNAARAREEAAGLVRWLRPDYQRPLLERGAGFREEAPAMVPPPPPALPPRPVFPADVIDQPLAVERLLAGSGRAMTPAEIAEAFAPGRRVGPRAARALQTLLRFGRIVDLGDGRMLAARGGSGAARAAP
ncbi:type IIL restriction-modification enzyme MmeI [Aurantimonas sp. Leaf443]|uniref:type IIL restriction-modification enzyme MmeI n=1 Tax=Aurantimonas sp. Leaf443 TaxID=1736378 RepID=UPI0006F7A508|nr:type IIL restriction-modification enzyme MmeI [Aurantimonas sp. Leaf443]KQT86067.1 hypothetical protein ASG48_05655 [Aurantimonas sp. Leaf443]